MINLQNLSFLYPNCGWRDLNSHEHISLDSKSSASTNYATSAYTFFITIISINNKRKKEKFSDNILTLVNDL